MRSTSKPSLVEFATLYGVVGEPRASGKILFVPALLDLEDPSDQPEYLLDEHLEGCRRRGIPVPEFSGEEEWVRARIPPLFGFAPPPCAGNSEVLINVAFLAIMPFSERGPMRAYPFACSSVFDPDDSLEEYPPIFGLFFSARGPDRGTKALIARRFWSLFLREPDRLSPFIDIVASRWSDYYAVGFEHGSSFRADLFEETPEGEVDSHSAYLAGPLRWCEDCEGTGIEDLFPYTEDCATCGGTGSVTW